MSEHVAHAILDTIKSAGYHVGHFTATDRMGDTVAHADAIDAKTGERFAVNAGTLYEAAAELAEQVGFDLMDG